MQDSYVLKLSGKAELPERLSIGHNYKIGLGGSIVDETKSDNNDGSFTYTYRFIPVAISIIDDSGKTIQARDPRSRSQQLRAAIWREWQVKNSDLSFDDYYDREMLKLIQSRINGVY